MMKVPMICVMVACIGIAAACDTHPKPRAGATVQPAAISWVGPTPGPGTTSVPATNPYSGDRTAITEGYQYFKGYNCAGCHGDHGGGGMGPSLRDSLWLYGGADADVFSSVYQGRDKGMPAWGTKLSPEQIWKIVAYIKSMRTANEPEPPN